MGKIFGGSKSTQQSASTSNSSSSNQAFPQIQQAFGGLTGQAQTGADSLQKLLGGDSSGFDAYKNATGYNAQAEAGSRGITGNAAAGGMLRSGGVGKALQSFGTNLQNSFAGSYMDRLLQQIGVGQNAGSQLTAAGGVSNSNSNSDATSTSKSKPGIGGLLGGLMSGGAASDRRLKKNIHKIKTRPDGLGVYQYRYIDGRGPFIGVMADEVKSLRPEAIGPEIGGYMTVNYEAL